MSIRLKDAAYYYKGLEHQERAFNWLEDQLDGETLGKFAYLYRQPPAKPANTITDKIINRLDNLGIELYNGGKNGYGVTIIGVEGVDLKLNPHADRMDEWNDIALLIRAYETGNYEIVGPFVCTTEPGRYYTQTRVLNRRGAAYVKLDTKHNGIWQLGWHKDQKDCLIQTGNSITVIRDEDQDGLRDRGEYEDTGYFGINFHHTKGNYNPKSIGKWSAGCCVLPSPQEHRAIVNAFKKSGQSKCSYVLLDGTKL